MHGVVDPVSDRECSVPGCGHVHDLQCALMSIASGGLQRVRHHVLGRWRIPEVLPAVGTEVKWINVDTNGDIVGTTLDEYPGLWEELQTTIARLSKSGESSPAGGKASEAPIPYHARASAVAHRMRNELSTWARIVAEERGLSLPADHPVAVARWLAEALAGAFVPSEMGSGIRGVVRDAERVIGQAPDMMFAGRCETPLTEEGRAAVKCDPNVDVPRCMADLYVRVESRKPGEGAKDDSEAKTKATVTCRACGAIHDVAYRKTWMAQHLSGALVTAGEATPYLSWLTGKDIKVDTIHKWRTRAGRLQAHEDRAGQPLYRFRDLLPLAEELKTRNTRPRKEGSAA